MFFLLQTEVPTSNLRRIINSRNTISEENCGARGPTGTSVSFMECNAEGFIGAYDPPALHLHNLLLENDKGDYSSNVSLNLFRRRRLLADSPISKVVVTDTIPEGGRCGQISHKLVVLSVGEILGKSDDEFTDLIVSGVLQ